VEEVILSLDPGKDKCGLAIVSDTLKVKLRKVIKTTEVVKEVEEAVTSHQPQKILIGSGTFSRKIRETLKNVHAHIPREVVDEKYSTEQARRRFFRENPPRGLWRLIPTSLQVPKEPVDDYAAVVLAEKYFGAYKGD
jgi:RNase H-fold protein (predicted Holliday junction resolvase)